MARMKTVAKMRTAPRLSTGVKEVPSSTTERITAVRGSEAPRMVVTAGGT